MSVCEVTWLKRSGSRQVTPLPALSIVFIPPWLIGLLLVRAVTCGALLCVFLGLRARRWTEILTMDQYLEGVLVLLARGCTRTLAASSVQEDQELRPLNVPDKLSRVQSAWLSSLLRWTPTSVSRSARPSRGLPDTRTRGLGGVYSDTDGSLDIEEIWQHWGRHHGVSKHHMLQFISEHAFSSDGRRRFLLRSDTEGRTWVSVTQSLRRFTKGSPSTTWPRCITNTGCRPEGLRWRRSLDLFWELSGGRLYDRLPAPGRRFSENRTFRLRIMLSGSWGVADTA